MDPEHTALSYKDPVKCAVHSRLQIGESKFVVQVVQKHVDARAIKGTDLVIKLPLDILEGVPSSGKKERDLWLAASAAGGIFYCRYDVVAAENDDIGVASQTSLVLATALDYNSTHEATTSSTSEVLSSLFGNTTAKASVRKRKTLEFPQCYMEHACRKVGNVVMECISISLLGFSSLSPAREVLLAPSDGGGFLFGEARAIEESLFGCTMHAELNGCYISTWKAIENRTGRTVPESRLDVRSARFHERKAGE